MANMVEFGSEMMMAGQRRRMASGLGWPVWEGGTKVAGKTSSSRKRADEYRLADAALDGTLDEWPAPPPRAPKTPAEKARLALIQSPGQVHRLAWTFSDVGRASTLASLFRRAKPSKLDPSATGTFDARAFFDPDERKWRIAARYVPPTEQAPPTGP